MAATKTNVERKLGTVVRKAMDRFSVPGVAVGIVDRDTEHRVSEGVTCVEFPLDVDSRTMFQIGSTTKTYTGTVLMMLAEEGELDLEQPVRRYLPSFKLKDAGVAEQALVRHLVTHTGGWVGDYFDDLGRGDDALRKIVRRMASKTPQVTPLGAAWSYNNSGFYVAGRIIEELTGEAYEDVVTKRILEPLGMHETFWFPEDVITRKTAIGHLTTLDGTHQVARPWGLTRAANPAGGIVSTVDDQLRYARFHLGDPPRVLPVRVLKQMRKQLAEAGSMADGVGVTWLLEKIGGVRIAKHGGSINGHMSSFVLVPDRHFAVVVLTNGSRGHELGKVVVDWALAEIIGAKREEPSFTALRDTVDFVGRYKAAYGRFDVTGEDDGLLLTSVPSKKLLEEEPEVAAMLPPPLPLGAVGKDRFVVRGSFNQGARVEFLRDDDGKVAWMRHGGRIHVRDGA